MTRMIPSVAVAGLALALVTACATRLEAPAALAAIDNPRATMSVSIDIEPGLSVTAGTAMSFQVTPSEPVYVNVFMFNESGRTFQLATDARTSASSPLVLPPRGADYALEAMEPAGVDQILVIATRSALYGGEYAGGPRQLASSQINTLEDLRARLAALPARDWASAGERIVVMEETGWTR